jgi:tetratricopeptide (TPR) repeat protein
MIKWKIFLGLVIVSGVASGQGSRVIDSLNNLLHASDDSVKMVVLDRLFFEYLNSEPGKAKECAESQIELCKKNNFKSHLFSGWMNLGSFYRQEGNYKDAEECYIRSLETIQKNDPNISNLYINFAIMYGEMKEYDKSLEYDFKSLQYKRKNIDTLDFENRQSLGILYNNIGADYFWKKDYTRSLQYFMAVLKIAMEQKQSDVLAATYNNIGSSYKHLGMYDKASDAYRTSLEIAEKTNNQLEIADASLNIGNLYSATGKFEKSLPFFERALAVSVSMGNKPQRLVAYQFMADAYEGLKDYKNSNAFLQKYIDLNDSLLDEKKSEDILALQTKFETREKEKENIILSDKNQIQALELSRKNYFVSALGGLLLVTLFFAWLLLRQNKFKSQRQALLLEQKLLRSQMNPHFIFNSLATIESFIYEKQPKEAGRYLSDFARLMRLILENSSVEHISLEKEIKTLEYYLVLQKLRLDDNLDYRISIDPAIDPEEVQIPPMLTQPFIENAIEHGFRGSNLTGKIDISFRKEEQQLVVEVRDNGIGINAAMRNEEKQIRHKSMAMQITRERLDILNRPKKQKMSFSVTDISENDN